MGPVELIVGCSVTPYNGRSMISLRRKSATRRGPARVDRDHASKIERILAALEQATEPAEMDLPGFRLKALKGRRKGHYCVWVSGTWHMTFRFQGSQALDIDYVDLEAG